MEPSTGSGIVVVHFTYQGHPISAQYSVDQLGIYAFSLDDPDAYFDTLTPFEKSLGSWA